MCSDKNSKLFEVVIRFDDGGLIFDELFLGRMKGFVLLSSLQLIFRVLESGVF